MNLSERLVTTAFAFRGYNTTNLGRTHELLTHRAYGPTVARWLSAGSAAASDIVKRPIDLVTRVRRRRESTIATFAEDVPLIMAIELAQLELLRDFHGIDYRQSSLAAGYSLGEVTALVAGGVLELDVALRPLVAMADDCAALARDVTMGIVFSRGANLDLDRIQRLCVEISSRGRGTISVSSYLSPNSILVLGQGRTVSEFRQRLQSILPTLHVRENSARWPPLHTPILRQRCIPDRAAVLIESMPVELRPPCPAVVSLVTGKASYNDYNGRELLNRWIDEPQRLWDMVCEFLAAGIELVVHVGPSPNLVPATFKRLSDNVSAQLQGNTFNSFGLRAMSGIARRAWLAQLLSARTVLLRAPFVHHVVLEDWLLDQSP